MKFAGLKTAVAAVAGAAMAFSFGATPADAAGHEKKKGGSAWREHTRRQVCILCQEKGFLVCYWFNFVGMQVLMGKDTDMP